MRLKQSRVTIAVLQLTGAQMTAALIKAVAKGAAKNNSKFDTLIQLSLFSGIGLLISVGILVFDKYMPGEWF